MNSADLAAAMTREHHDIDRGIEAFLDTLAQGRFDPQPLMTAFEALRRHIYLEEEFLFPPIRSAGLLMPVLVMIKEHGLIWQQMATIEKTVRNREPEEPAEAADLQRACEELLDHLDRHNSKEEPIIYPHAVVDLSPEAQATFADFLRTASTPVGWVCEGAARS